MTDLPVSLSVVVHFVCGPDEREAAVNRMQRAPSLEVRQSSSKIILYNQTPEAESNREPALSYIV